MTAITPGEDMLLIGHWSGYLTRITDELLGVCCPAFPSASRPVAKSDTVSNLKHEQW